MRLGTCILIALAAAAIPLCGQGARQLPWELQQPLDWQVAPPSSAQEPLPAHGGPAEGPVRVLLAGDGTLRVRDPRGLIRLQMGLPGRPLKAWRDGGLALAPAAGTWTFAADSPLIQGLGGLKWCADDFRPFFRGLLWVLEDGEDFLVVVHPATAQVIYLPLPAGRDLDLRFLPDRLEVTAGDAERGAPHRWFIPWVGLLPRLAALGPRAEGLRTGTAMVPFPKD